MGCRQGKPIVAGVKTRDPRDLYESAWIVGFRRAQVERRPALARPVQILCERELLARMNREWTDDRARQVIPDRILTL